MITAGNLHAAFLPFGEIVDISIPKPEAPNSTELHRGFGYVEFEDPEDAKEAIDNMDQAELFGRVIKVSAAKPQKNVNEGLGSKTAIWEQVSICILGFFRIVFSNMYCRRAGLQKTLSVKKISWLRNKLELAQMRGQKTQCKAWRDWMLQVQSSNDG
jgi:RNA recognition motif-containing protein